MRLSNILQLLAIWTVQILSLDIPGVTSAGWERCSSAERDLPPTLCSPSAPAQGTSKCWWMAAEQYGFFFFPGRNTQQRLNPCTERGISVWTIPKQKSPTCQQGLLKYTPETGQLKLSVRQSRVHRKSQASKRSREQSEKKKLSLWDGVLELR